MVAERAMAAALMVAETATAMVVPEAAVTATASLEAAATVAETAMAMVMMEVVMAVIRAAAARHTPRRTSP